MTNIYNRSRNERLPPLLHTHIRGVLTTEAVIAEHKLTIYPDYLPLTVMLTRLIAETKLKLPNTKKHS